MHYYKRNIGDYAKKAGRLSMLQHGSYTLLIDSCYDRERFPTLEEAIEWTWASTEAEIEAVKFVLSRFFTLDNEGRYVQDRILQEVAEYQAKSDKNKKIAIERETKRKENSTLRAENDTKRKRVVNESPPNQEPRTNNQEPITNKKPKKAAPSIDPIFESIWKIYPKRPGASKADTLKAYRARLNAGVTPNIMLEGAHQYARYCKVAGIEPQYIKQPATFFGSNEHYLSDWTPPKDSGHTKDLPLATNEQIEHAYRVECGGDPTQARFGSYMEMRKFIVDRREKRRVGV